MFSFEKKLKNYPYKVDRLIHQDYQNCLSTVLLYLSSGHCNQDCIYCDKNFYKIPTRHFDRALLEKLVEDFILLGVDSVIILGEGAEPILDPNFPWLVHLLCDHHIHCGVYTNASVCTPELLKALKRMDFVRISLDAGNETTHRAIHTYAKSRSDFKTATALMHALSGITNVGISYIIMDENINEIFDTYQFASALKIDYMELKMPLQEGYVYDAISKEAFLSIKKQIHKIRKDTSAGVKLILNKHIEYLLESEELSEDLTKCDMRNCYTCAFRTVISPLGYFLCTPNKNKSEYRYGDPFKIRLKDAWCQENIQPFIGKLCTIRCTYDIQNAVLQNMVSQQCKELGDVAQLPKEHQSCFL